MKRKNMAVIVFVVLIAGVLGINNVIGAASKAKTNTNNQEKQAVSKEAKEQKKTAIKATFVELGSVNCIPCKMMQPVMKDIEEEYGDQVKIIFYDVWTKEGKPYGDKYKIRAIPTQVFLDKDGKEFYRHQGFFPKEEIVKVLKMQGVK